MSRLSVIVPSRLQKNPGARPDAGDLYLDRSLMSVVRNARDANLELEILVGLDAGTPDLPLRYRKCLAVSPELTGNKCQLEAHHEAMEHLHPEESWPVEGWRPSRLAVARSSGTGQSQAVNAAAKLITGDYVAMIEDDDVHRPDKLAVQLQVLSQGYKFVSTTQREVGVDGAFLRTNAFACPSTWLMPRETWEAVGPFDETLRWHVDTEWLGRLNQVCAERGWKRAHVLHEGAEADGSWVANVGQFSDLLRVDEVTDPLVDRTVNPGGGMSAIRNDHARLLAEFKAGPPIVVDDFQEWGATREGPFGESLREHQAMMKAFGYIPW